MDSECSDKKAPRSDENKQTSNLKWEYLAEGCSSVVFHCKEQRIVLRIKKQQQDHDENSSRSCVFSLVDQMQFHQAILKSVFQDDRYFVEPTVVSISDEFHKRLQETMLSSKKRPDKRLQSGFDKGARDAVILPHLGFIQEEGGRSGGISRSFAVEIKPKWGYLPNASSRIKKCHKVKFSKCRFCMHQHLKWQLGKTSSISGYCPLDLFDSCTCRVKRAVTSLFATPQNNLRVFYDGKLMYSGLPVEGNIQDVSELDDFLTTLYSTCENDSPPGLLTSESIIDIIVQIIYHDSWRSTESVEDRSPSRGSSEKCKKLEVEATSNICRPLGPDGVLQKLISAQKLDQLDIEGIFPLFSELQASGEFSKIADDLANFSSSIWRDFLESFEGTRQVIGEQYLSESSLDETISQIQKFLIAATFKDCSMMITFQRQAQGDINDCDSVIKSATGDPYKYQIKLFDLDPKSVYRLNHYYELDHNIIRNYLLGKEGKQCCY